MRNKWELISYVQRGKNREKVFLALEEPVMPSELVRRIYGKTSNTHFNVVSRALHELRKIGLVDIKNPKEKTGRIYKLSKQGKSVRKEL